MNQRLEHSLSRLFLAGLALAVLLMLAGVGLALAGTDEPVAHETSFSDLPGSLARLEAGGFFQLGLLVLLGTPAIRMLALTIGFARRRVWLFSLFSFMVFAVLALSVVVGLSI